MGLTSPRATGTHLPAREWDRPPAREWDRPLRKGRAPTSPQRSGIAWQAGGPGAGVVGARPRRGQEGRAFRPTAPRWRRSVWAAGIRGGRAGTDWNGPGADQLRGMPHARVRLLLLNPRGAPRYSASANATSSTPGIGD